MSKRFKEFLELLYKKKLKVENLTLEELKKISIENKFDFTDDEIIFHIIQDFKK
jgi:hypothetical protein